MLNSKIMYLSMNLIPLCTKERAIFQHMRKFYVKKRNRTTNSVDLYLCSILSFTKVIANFSYPGVKGNAGKEAGGIYD